MARQLYSTEFVQFAGSASPAPNLFFRVWTDLIAGSDVTSQIVGPDGSSPYAAVTDSQGNIAPFRGPDGYLGNLFVDTGASYRFMLDSPTLLDYLVASVGSGGGSVTDHGALSGLLDDDHPQYHNDTRGDARYYTQAQVTAAINTAVTSSSTADRNRANHSGTQLASSISDFSSAVQAIAGPSSTPDWSVITNKPTTFTPSAHTHPAGQISDSTVTGRAVVTAVDAQAARVAIGAGTGNGTSNLALGTTATTAAAGNHGHAASALTFTPAGSITATDVQAAIVQASQSGGGSGVSAVFVWRYSAGGWPAMSATKPAGVFEVRALGPSYPTAIPTWVGLAATQVPMSYSKVDVA